MFCTACGTQNPDKAYFCSRCGNRIRPATEPPAAPPSGNVQAPETIQPSPVQNPSATPTSGAGSSWIDPQALRPKPGDSWVRMDAAPGMSPSATPAKPGSSWVQMDGPQIGQAPAAKIPGSPPLSPATVPVPASGTSWIDPSAQGPKPADSWVRFSQPAVSAQGAIPPASAQGYGHPAQPYAQPGYPTPAYHPAYPQPPYAQGFPPQGYAAPGQAQMLRGVGGWLMFFIVCLTILGPLSSLFLVVLLLIGAGVLANSNPESARFATVLALLIIPYSVWGMIVGMGLWKVRSGAVRQAKMFLIWGSIPFTCLANLLPFLMLSPANLGNQSAATTFISMAIFVGIALAWHSYLAKSRRVALTYPQG